MLATAPTRNRNNRYGFGLPIQTRIPPPPSAAGARRDSKPQAASAMPASIEEDDPMLDYPPEDWISSMIGTRGLLYRFSDSLVYKTNITPREADLIEAAGDLTLKLRTRVLWKGSRSPAGTKAVIIDHGRRFMPPDVAPDKRKAVVLEMFLLLDKLHNQHGIVHGDIRASKFLWGRDGRLKLVDYGSAKFITEDPKSWNACHATETHFTSMRARRPRDSGNKVDRIPPPTVFDDYYALAVTIWTMFTGKVPGSHQFNTRSVKRSDLAKVDDDQIRRWIRKVFKMAGCIFL
ncbi:hypothetical protein B0T17DRAFT_507974 [Bombardia bombarda]|uniref:Protein kinase domain-containing protein n=1 Tax=Bombardia bombarda TaxID=252184 RepID=A0AA39X0F0_9PEZI|nr:hypothetical protein B0T17DRAFT_507974 [Bombardia bombarda]